MSLPKGVQISHQKLIRRPLPTLALMKREAKHRRFKRARYVQDFALSTSQLQTFSFLILFDFIQTAHREGPLANSSHNNFRHNILFQRPKSRNPKPPSVFGRQTVAQATLYWTGPEVFPLHKNIEHKLWMRFRHPFGRIKAEVQKFIVP